MLFRSIQQLGRVVDAGDQPAWLQVVHDSNLENYVRGSRTRLGALSGCFDVQLPASAANESALEIGVDRLRTWVTSTGIRLHRSIKWRLGLTKSD